jgi:cobalt/nickel transport system permease protein
MKLIVALAFCVCCVTTPPRAYMTLAVYGGLVVVAVLVNWSVIGEVLLKTGRALPLLIVLVVLIPVFKPGRPVWQWGVLTLSAEGLQTAGLVFCGALLCIGAFALLSATTSEGSLLSGLRGIGVPAMLTGVMAVMLRYAHVLRPELTRLRHARDARTIGSAGPGPVRSGANLLGTLFVRSFARAERVADAMAARGYDGRHRIYRRHPVRVVDVIGAVGALGIIVLIRIVNV